MGKQNLIPPRKKNGDQMLSHVQLIPLNTKIIDVVWKIKNIEDFMNSELWI